MIEWNMLRAFSNSRLNVDGRGSAVREISDRIQRTIRRRSWIRIKISLWQVVEKHHNKFECVW